MNLKYQVSLFKAKRRMGLAQGVIAKRRLELMQAIKPLVSNHADWHIIETALRPKKISSKA